MKQLLERVYFGSEIRVFVSNIWEVISTDWLGLEELCLA